MAGYYPTSHRSQADKLGFMQSSGDWLGSLGESIDSGLETLGDTAMDVAATTVAPLMQHLSSQITPFELPSWDDLTGRSAQQSVPRPVGPAPSAGRTGLPDPFSIPTGSPTSATAPRSSTDSTPFSLPSWSELTGRPAQPSAPGATPAAPPPAPTMNRGVPPGAPSQPGGLADYIRQSARARGIDPETAIKVAMAEGGVSDPVRQSDVVYQGQREQSYGPFQLNVNGGLGSAALQQGIDPRNPAHVYRAIDFALDDVAKNGWGAFHGAARVGVGPRQGIGTAPTGATGPVPAQAAASAQAGQTAPGGPPRFGTYTAETLTPNQFTEGQAQGLSTEEALAVCGPAAAVAFARANGRSPTLREAKELAQNLGLWDVDSGMHGPASQVQLLQKMGVPSTLAEGADWGRIAREVQAGRPVIVDTPMHYFTVTGFNPQTGEFELGQSAGVLRKSGGKTSWRPEDLPALGMGSPRATIFMGGR